VAAIENEYVFILGLPPQGHFGQALKFLLILSFFDCINQELFYSAPLQGLATFGGEVYLHLQNP
jgi:hypothetical protein